MCVCSTPQSCPTLCDPMDCSPPGSSVRGILQARILEWAPCPPPGDLPDPGIELASLMFPARAGGFLFLFLPLVKLGKPRGQTDIQILTSLTAYQLQNVSFISLPPPGFSTAGWRLHLVIHSES